MGSKSNGRPVTVCAAIAANSLIAISKFIVAAITRSSAMLSEGIHSLADTGNQALLLLGIKLSKRPASQAHPFGRGQEVYFWSLIVAIMLFGLGGGLSLYEGIAHLRQPAELGNPFWNYIVLGLAAIFEGSSLTVAYRELRRTTDERNLVLAVHDSKDPSAFVVLFEDSAALAGLLVAFLGVFLGHRLGMPVLDALASILIAVILMAVAIFLAYESRELLLGESAAPEIVKSIEEIVSADDAIVNVFKPMTMHMSPDEVLLNMDLTFRRDLSSNEIAAAIDRPESEIQSRHPQVTRIVFEAETLRKQQD
jgi:cation diffusion facilitator family transporter